VRAFRWSTIAHRWLALIVGVQIFFWVAGGLVMTLLPIERVRGEHRVAEATPSPLDLGSLLSPAEAARRAGVSALAKAELKSSPRGPIWILTPVRGEPVVVAAGTGLAPPRIGVSEAKRLAAVGYRGPGRPVSAVFFETAPEETGREGPLWRIDFDDPERTSFYLSPDTGEVVSKRSGLWRVFDLMWKLHAMDWDDGEDFNHPLMILTAALATVIVLTGFVLLWFRMAPAAWRGGVRKGPPG